MKDITPKENQWQNFTDWFKKFKKKKGKSVSHPRRLYILLMLAAAIYYYIYLPALNYAVMEFWIFLGLIVIGILIIEFLHDGVNFLSEDKESGAKSTHLIKKSLKYKLLIYPWFLVALVGFISWGIFSPLFIADKYANMIKVENADFKKDFPQTDLASVPLIDRDTAMRLGNRRLGALTDLVSQFEVADDYTQINIKSKPVRVTPLQYAGFFKWVNNFSKGIPNYLEVDTVTGEVALKTPKAPIKYSYADKFNRNIMRHLRFNYPFTLFEAPSFEVDDEGNPFYVATTYKRNFFLREPEVSGVITVNAMTGETHHYSLKDSPTWIDRVYSADLVLHQLKMRGLYVNGFWNAQLAKTGVTEPTEGYNYIPLGDDLYLYTGITSVSADESNIGFVLVNLRTKAAKLYPIDAAEEFSAMKSAEGSVQETEYTATFPLLVNLNGRPMYVLTLKDNSGLIRKYALVDVQNYQKVYVEDSVNKLIAAYAQDYDVASESLETEEDLQAFSGQIDRIQAVVVDGNTVYYFMMGGQVYQADIGLNKNLPFVEAGQTISFKANPQGIVRELELKP